MRLFVAGTDTDVGKTVFAAALAGALGAFYWKPIQVGSLDRSDSATVRALSGLPSQKILADGYRLKTPCSPHRAAEIDGIAIDCDALEPPDIDPLIVEGAGGLMVPVTRDVLVFDLIARWRLPVVLVARTSLGTINHSLLSLDALHAWDIPVLGVAFVGQASSDSEEIICGFSGAKRLGCLPHVDPLDQHGLRQAFIDNFSLDDFR